MCSLFIGDDSSDDGENEENDSQDSDDLEELKELSSLGLPGNGISVADVLKKATNQSENLKVLQTASNIPGQFKSTNFLV